MQGTPAAAAALRAALCLQVTNTESGVKVVETGNTDAAKQLVQVRGSSKTTVMYQRAVANSSSVVRASRHGFTLQERQLCTCQSTQLACAQNRHLRMCVCVVYLLSLKVDK